MILKRLFRRTPSWRHRDPRVRQQAARGLAADDPHLLELVVDADPGVRRAALERIGAPAVLLDRLAAETNATVREIVLLRLRQVLAGRGDAALALDQRLAVLADPRLPEELFVPLASEGAEVALRLAALARVQAGERLVEIAIADPSAEVRLAAVERLHEPAALERVLRDSRGRDKRVHRIARERLAGHASDTAARARVQALCEAMEQLAAQETIDAAAAARFLQLERDWAAAGDTAAHAARYQAARVQVDARLREHNARLLGAQRLAQRLAACADGGADVATLDALAADWEAAGRPGGGSFGERLAELRAAAQRRAGEHAGAAAREALLRELDGLAVPRRADLERLRAAWEQAPAGLPAPLREALQQRFEAALGRARERQARQYDDAQAAGSALAERIAAFERALDAGELREAGALADQIQAAVADGSRPDAALTRRLQAGTARLAQLRGWQRWGGSQAREHLCESAAALVGSALDPAEIARRVQALREAWKRLDHEGAPSARALWDRFNTTCEAAYAPCREHFQAAAEARRASLGARNELCEQLEACARDTDWSAPDWRALERVVREAVRAWRTLGPAPRASHKALERRFRQAQDAIGRRLDAERARERTRRERLIEELERHTGETTELRAAIAAAKQAQAAWAPTVQLPRDAEQALWLRFRAVCDAIFARREAERESVEAERRDNLAARLAACAELEELARLQPPDAVLAARLRAAELVTGWEHLGPVPRGEAAALDARFEAARAAFAAGVEAAERARDRRAVRELAEKAALCARAEELALAGAPIDAPLVEEIHADWAGFAMLPPELERRLQARLEFALAAHDDEALAALAATRTAGADTRRLLCLRLEHLAGFELPPEQARTLLEFRVNQLPDAFGRGEREVDEAAAIIIEWYCTPAPRDAELDTRFATALLVLGRA